MLSTIILQRHYRNLFAFLVVLLSTVLGVQAGTYSVVSMYSDDSPPLLPAYSAYAVGISLPVDQAGETLYYSVSITAAPSTSAYQIFSSASSAKDVMAMFGPAGTKLTWELFVTPVLSAETFDVFAPLSQSINRLSTTFLESKDQVYWTMPSEQAQAVGLLAMLANQELFPINHVFYSTERYTGRSAVQFYKILCREFGCTVFYYASESHDFNQYAYAEAVGLQPRIVYQYGLAEGSSATESWSTKLVADPTLAQINTTIATTFEMQFELLRIYNDVARSAPVVLPPGNIVTAAPVPGVDAVEYAAAVDFLEQGAGWMKHDMTRCLKNYMMAGWLSGSALIQALNKYTGASLGDSEKLFMALLLAQSSYVVSDLFIGTHGWYYRCSKAASQQGLLCKCRHAGNNIWFHRFAKSGQGYDTVAARGELFQYALDMCANLIPPGDSVRPHTPYEQLIRTPVPIHVAGLAPADNRMMETMCRQTHDVITRLSNKELYHHVSAHTYRSFCVPSTVDTMVTKLHAHTSNYVMTSMMGVIPDHMATPNTLILDYVPETTQPHKTEANLVYLFPTLEQELYVLASYLRSVVTEESVVCATVRHSTVSESIVSLLKMTLSTFRVRFDSSMLTELKVGLLSNIPSTCTHTFVVGMDEVDAAGVVKHLQSNVKSVVLASFDDLTKYYSLLSPAFYMAGATVTDRFVFATNLPTWTSLRLSGSAAPSVATVDHFLQSVPEELHTPAAVRAFIVAMMYDQLSAGGEPGTGDMQLMLYGNVSWSVAGMRFGPFSRVCMDVASSSAHCLYNYGARSISVWSYSRILNPATEVLQQAVNPSMAYSTRDLPAKAVTQPAVREYTDEDCVVVALSSSSVMAGEANESLVSPISSADDNGVSGIVIKDDDTDDAELNALLVALFIILCAAIVVTVLLLLVSRGSCGCLWRWCAGSDADGAAVLCAREKQARESLALQRAAQDVLRAPPVVDDRHPITFVCVDVVQYRELWVSSPDVMSLAVAEYQRSVRESIVRHDCYEVTCVDGLFVIACCSADAGVGVARDCSAACRACTWDAGTVDAAYAALNCGCGAFDGGGGLRLRIAVHHGTATVCGTAEAESRFVWSGGAVDDVVCAACCSRTAWTVVVTAGILCELQGEEALHLDPLCTAALPHSGPTKLFTVRERKHSERTVVPLVAGSYTHVLRVMKGLDCRNAVARALCEEYLTAYLSCCCFHHEFAYLTSLVHCHGLPAVGGDDYVDEDAYFAVLLRMVCDRLCALLECRHSPRSDCGTSRSQPPGVSCSGSVETSVECWDSADPGRCGLSMRKAGLAPKLRDSSQSKRSVSCGASDVK